MPAKRYVIYPYVDCANCAELQKQLDQLQDEYLECEQREQDAKKEAQQLEEKLAHLSALCEKLQAGVDKKHDFEQPRQEFFFLH